MDSDWLDSMVRTEAFAHLINDKLAAQITRKYSRIQPVKEVFRCEQDPNICLTTDRLIWSVPNLQLVNDD